MDSVRKHFKGNPFHGAAFLQPRWIKDETTSLDGAAKKRPSLEVLALKPCEIRVIGPCVEAAELPIERTLSPALRRHHKGSIDSSDYGTPLVGDFQEFVSESSYVEPACLDS